MKTLTLIEAAAALGAVAVQKMEEESGSLSSAARAAAEKLAAVNDADTDPAEAWTEDTSANPLLLDAVLQDGAVPVVMPDGSPAVFRLDSMNAVPWVVLIHIYPAASRFANVFRKSSEGVHHFIGRAGRMENGGAA